MARPGLGVEGLDSGLVAVLNSSTPLMTLALAVLVGQERLYRIGCSVGIAIAGTDRDWWGDPEGRSALALIVTVSRHRLCGRRVVARAASPAGRRRFRPRPSSWVLGARHCSGCVADERAIPFRALDRSSPARCSLSVCSELGSALIYFTLIERVGATSASMVTYLVPVVGLVWGALVRGERFGDNVLLGAAVLIAACGSRSGGRAPPFPVKRRQSVNFGSRFSKFASTASIDSASRAALFVAWLRAPAVRDGRHAARVQELLGSTHASGDFFAISRAVSRAAARGSSHTPSRAERLTFAADHDAPR